MPIRDQKSNTFLVYAVEETPLGWMMVAATRCGLCRLQFGDSEASLADGLRAEFPAAALAPLMSEPGHPLAEWIKQLRRYLRGESPDADVPVDVPGGAFAQAVWRQLRSIPSGRVETYQRIATAMGRPRSARAVGQACASNRVALAIPCHRAVRGDGGLGGYRWGVERKRKLLEMESRWREAGSDLFSAGR